MKSLLLRTVSGAVYVTIILLALFTHPAIFKILTLAMNIIAVIEFRNMGQKMGVEFTPAWLYLNILTFISELILMHWGLFNDYGSIPVLIYLVSIFTITLYHKKENPFTGSALAIFAGLFISLPLILLNLIHIKSIDGIIPYSFSIFIFIWVNDTFAYLTGMALGRHRLFERISPKKSWEGFAGGLLMTLVISYFFYKYYTGSSMSQWLILGGLSSLASVFGDFNESLLKRVSGIKDSGNIIPGHGGMLDRIDSLLLVSIVIYIYLTLI